ncbi:MAG: formylglycine-generating enzyme family protein [Opitutales bacterium]|nr:formylglycine-generating enzyme family protein [Opitutales bacterium]
MKKKWILVLSVTVLVTLLMEGGGVGDSGPDGLETDQTTAKTPDAKTAQVAKIDLAENETRATTKDGKTVREEKTGKKPFTIPGLSMEMLWCKPGTFTMGSPKSEKDRDDDETPHTVTLTSGFYLGKHEVTQSQWELVMGSNPSWFKGADRPVETVSWHDATSFCEKLTKQERKAGRLPAGMTYQLPTEAQWEYACRAGTKTAHAFGEASGEMHRHGNYADRNTNFDWSNKAHDDGFKNISSVGSHKPNGWGFHDMHGNVFEWCADSYGDYPSGAARDPAGPAYGSARVGRGGSWSHTAYHARSANRGSLVPAYGGYDFLGFRLSLRPASKAE